MRLQNLPILFVFLLLLTIQFSFAQEPTEIYNRENLLLSLNISSSLLLSVQQHGEITSLTAILGLVPLSDDHQTVVSLETSPSATQTDDAYLYSWQNPTSSFSSLLPFSLSANVQTSFSTIPVHKKVFFPILFVDTSLQKYLQETNMTDFSDPAVDALANQLASGQDDMYAVAVKMADWVQHNISYNLTTQTAQAAQPASWVLENRYGVCDELTNLYIALLRSVGIPARFTVGIAYSNSPLFQNLWNPHGWAEVYFPDTGWVPFDLTYGEYGFLDATHIKLHDALDANQAGISYAWVGRDATVTSSGINISAIVLDTGEIVSLPVTLSLSSLHDAVGFGSSTLIIATLHNTASYYVPLHLAFATSSEIVVDGNLHPTVLLGPKETKYAYWILHIPQLDSSYKYSFDAVVALFTNQTATTTFSTSAYDPVYTADSLAPFLSQYQQQEEKTYTSQIGLHCSVASFFYPENISPVTCVVQNQGTLSQDLSACLETSCTSFSLGIGNSHEVSFSLSNITPGNHLSSVTVSNDQVMQVAAVSYAVLDIPSIEIVNLTLPETVAYGDAVPVSFVLHKTSFQTPSALSVLIHYGNKQQLAEFGTLVDSQHLDFVLNTTAFRREQNTIFFTIEYIDSLGNSYEKQESYVVTLSGLSFWKKIKLYVLGFLGM